MVECFRVSRGIRAIRMIDIVIRQLLRIQSAKAHNRDIFLGGQCHALGINNGATVIYDRNARALINQMSFQGGQYLSFYFGACIFEAYLQAVFPASQLIGIILRQYFKREQYRSGLFSVFRRNRRGDYGFSDFFRSYFTIAVNLGNRLIGRIPCDFVFVIDSVVYGRFQLDIYA